MSLSRSTITPEINYSRGTQPDRRETIMLLVVIGLFFILSVVVILSFQNEISTFLGLNQESTFDDMIVTDGFHIISLPNGTRWDISYEAKTDIVFPGLVRHSTPIKESGFEILSRDILITNGDFSNPDFVATSVVDHHFTWSSLKAETPKGTLNLLHTVPMNQEINQLLNSIKVGDTVAIRGWEILRINGWDKNGTPIGFWQDAGCNTILVTEVKILGQEDN
jgi:hypothetical protein